MDNDKNDKHAEPGDEALSNPLENPDVPDVDVPEMPVDPDLVGHHADHHKPAHDKLPPEHPPAHPKLSPEQQIVCNAVLAAIEPLLEKLRDIARQAEDANRDDQAGGHHGQHRRPRNPNDPYHQMQLIEQMNEYMNERVEQKIQKMMAIIAQRGG